MSAAPPRLSISSNTRTLQIAYAEDIAVNTKRTDLTFSALFNYPPNKGLRFQYREAKILNARVYWQSDNPTADTGSVCLNVEDYGENTGSDTCVFNELLSYPGSMVRKVWQNVSNRWYPTEPSDREYHDISSTDGILTYTVRHSITASSLKGRIVVFANVRMRGKSTTRQLSELLRSEYLDSATQDMGMVVLDGPATS